MARPKKAVEVPGQESASTESAGAKTAVDQQQVITVDKPQPSEEALQLEARNTLLATINEQGAAIIARFEEYGFTDVVDHPLTNCLEFLQLVKKATTAAPAAPHGYVTNEEGKKQPAAGKPVLTEHGWHVPG
ncbi:hypothetical protein [Pluralibacter gergoviae]|uniref:hypothetical protein n=1 Tax=Pluralibacter gergoviae TaxID=61647 RepID=UPI000651B9B3|nr:hypothetical protein [Pluralibacter gergoviae]ELN2738926.1 hypothetical protein [Pluralibacter gergoviae]KMK29538.1 hypothetical protein ABW12_22220 [Pluralibacter gergoviae]